MIEKQEITSSLWQCSKSGANYPWSQFVDSSTGAVEDWWVLVDDEKGDPINGTVVAEQDMVQLVTVFKQDFMHVESETKRSHQRSHQKHHSLATR